MEIVLEVVEKSNSTFYKINKEEITIGRNEETCDIIIEESGASKSHCLIEFRQHKWWVVDLDSKNGTYINNSQIKRSQFYLDDVIQIGESYIRFASSHMPLAICQQLRKPGKKYKMNKSITYIQSKKENKQSLTTGEHHGLKELSGVYDENEARGVKMLKKRKKKKKKS